MHAALTILVAAGSPWDSLAYGSRAPISAFVMT